MTTLSESLDAGRVAPVGKALMAIVVLVVVGCGGKSNPTSTPMATDRGEMANMPPPIARFHEALAPRWHAPHGPQRMTDTCAAIGQLHTDAAAIVAAPAPDGANLAAWSLAGQQLADAVTALEATCKASDAAAFEPAFARVHTSFHHALEAASTRDEHGEHEHKM